MNCGCNNCHFGINISKVAYELSLFWIVFHWTPLEDIKHFQSNFDPGHDLFKKEDIHKNAIWLISYQWNIIQSLIIKKNVQKVYITLNKNIKIQNQSYIKNTGNINVMFDYWEYVPFLSYYKTVKSILKDHSKFIEIHTL